MKLCPTKDKSLLCITFPLCSFELNYLTLKGRTHIVMSCHVRVLRVFTRLNKPPCGGRGKHIFLFFLPRGNERKEIGDYNDFRRSEKQNRIMMELKTLETPHSVLCNTHHHVVDLEHGGCQLSLFYLQGPKQKDSLTCTKKLEWITSTKSESVIP